MGVVSLQSIGQLCGVKWAGFGPKSISYWRRLLQYWRNPGVQWGCYTGLLAPPDTYWGESELLSPSLLGIWLFCLSSILVVLNFFTSPYQDRPTDPSFPLGQDSPACSRRGSAGWLWLWGQEPLLCSWMCFCLVCSLFLYQREHGMFLWSMHYSF